MKYAIYDNGWETMDRFTLILWNEKDNWYYDWIWFSQDFSWNPMWFFQYWEMSKWNHLWKEISLDTLSKMIDNNSLEKIKEEIKNY